MKKFVLTLSFIMIFSTLSFAQKQKTDPQAEQLPQKVNKQQNRKEKNNQQTQNQAEKNILSSATNVQAQLESALDVKNAKPGDSVILKTTKAVKQNGEVIIPKGTRLIGRVTEVQQKTKDSAVSKLGVVFDRLQSSKLDMPINATIVSISQAAANTNLGDNLNSDLSGSSSSAATVSRGGSGGGLLGGGLVGGTTNTVGSVLNSTTQTVGGVTNTAGQTLGGTTQTVGRTLNGIQLSQAAGGATAGAATLSALNRDIKLEKGVTFNLSLSSSN